MFRDFPWLKVPIYIFAQTFGAFMGAAIVFANYRKAFTQFAGEGNYTVTGPNRTAEIFATYPSDIMTTEGSFFEEMLGTCILMILILAQTDHHNMYAGNMLPLAVGLCVAAIGFGLGYQTNYACKKIVNSMMALFKSGPTNRGIHSEPSKRSGSAHFLCYG